MQRPLATPTHCKAYYQGLDAVRFFAACSVLAFHMGFFSWAGHGTTADMFGGVARFDGLAPYCWFGTVGVQIFFVISGFVISASAANSTAREFAWGRFLRLYPGAWVCATVTLLFGTLVAAHISGGAYIRSLTLWLWGPWVDGSYWTLPIELCFYALIWAMLATAGFERVPWVAGALTIASLAYNGAALFGYSISPMAPLIGVVQRNHPFVLFDHGCFFALGIWMWLLVERKVAWPFVVFLIAAIIGCVAQMANYFFGMIDEVPIIRNYWTGSLIAPISVWGVAVAVIFVSARSARRGGGSGKEHGLLRAIGLMTYPLYLLHDAIGSGMMRLLILRGVAPLLSLLLAASLIVAASFVVCMYAEPSLRRTLRAVRSSLTAMFAVPKIALEPTCFAHKTGPPDGPKTGANLGD
jgi:exopolysaccharide production protein ExoZ